MDQINILVPVPENDLRSMGKFLADVFSNGQYQDSYCANYIGNSHYDWNVSRLMMDEGELVHHWGVWGYQMRLDSIQLKVAGIGAVATHPDYRKQGLMHRAAQASFDAMLQAGYDLSFLRGRHYLKMGYARAWNYVTYRFKLDDFPTSGLTDYQPLDLKDIPEKDALYNQVHSAFSGTAIRPTYNNRHADDICIYAWREASGDLAGYVRAAPAEDDPKTLLCLEAAGDPLQVLSVLGDLFKHGTYEKVACFTLPYLHPLLQHLRKGECTVEDRYFGVSGWRVRIINLCSTLQKLVPLFAQRLKCSNYSDWQGYLQLNSGEQVVILQIEKGKVTLVNDGPVENIIHGGADLARLLIGSDDPVEIIRQAGMDCTGQALSLASILFPNLHPMMSHWDEF